MSFARPTTIPLWATGSSAVLVEPLDGQKAAGWSVGERPPAQWLNWMQSMYGSWLQYLDQQASVQPVVLAYGTVSSAGALVSGSGCAGANSFGAGTYAVTMSSPASSTDKYTVQVTLRGAGGLGLMTNVYHQSTSVFYVYTTSAPAVGSNSAFDFAVTAIP